MKGSNQYALGNPIGKEHINPIIDTRIYELELPDETVYEYKVNSIIGNIIGQIDDQVCDTGILEEIVASWRDTDVAIPTGDQSYKKVNGIQRSVVTTKGWDIQAKWIYQSTDWVTLNIIKG